MLNLRALNSATKYPSIQTYHTLGERGCLTEDATLFYGDVVLTEKVDGANGRIVLMPDGDWFIGSREELLTARGDRVHNNSLGIVDVLRPVAERLKGGIAELPKPITVFFLEVYGARIGGSAKQYTRAGAVGCRMFDLAFIPTEVLGWEREQIAGWRDAGYQTFADEAVLQRAAEQEGIELTPRLATVPGDELPATVEEAYDWLKSTLPLTRVGLDDTAGGRPEGIVLRAADRSVIAKARFEDYERTLKARNAAPRRTRAGV